ncbi:Rho guanyl nucleotide exchange factor [Aspergillus luchuensis]|uniref:Rho guanyl nucleotide exchange factor n=1 Tax=Aspergillus kawachii TaxID=1069201 RepID=A0A146FY30_ASPKA|nr:Rho guanyl nucleotide exchange factor [Aspergillus luchuensis]
MGQLRRALTKNGITKDVHMMELCSLQEHDGGNKETQEQMRGSGIMPWFNNCQGVWRMQ